MFVRRTGLKLDSCYFRSHPAGNDNNDGRKQISSALARVRTIVSIFRTDLRELDRRTDETRRETSRRPYLVRRFETVRSDRIFKMVDHIFGRPREHM